MACSLSFGLPNHSVSRFRTHISPSSPHFSVSRFHSRPPILACSAVTLQSPETTSKTSTAQQDILACPICYEPLMRRGPTGLNLEAIYRSGFKCQICNKSYSSKNFYLDLTVTAGSEDYTENQPTRT